MDRDAFVRALGGIYENSPWVAEAAWEARPFPSLVELHQAMSKAVRLAGPKRQEALIKAHPELGQRAESLPMSDASRREQASAGLHSLSPGERERLLFLNQRYRERFGFPFIMAVKGATPSLILANLERRLENSAEDELATALAEIDKIALLRLCEVVVA